ncbi:TPA: hypothetical protein ACHF2S_001291 [Escherichia coli]|uniref:hypothetical protein n=1 Tax=Escherichia coli TaxID=562 RepID=UPI000A3ABD97|nr:hypothetical protein [Escherichia coli]AVU66243.1 hypothetical protein A9X72_13865 [Escherichia coli]OUG07626.1 hypothetical protein AZ048_003939 [Escherichia coli]
MARFRRVNIDGKSVTETAVSDAALKPGTPVKMAAGKFAAATDTEGRIYIVNPAYHEGLGIEDAIPVGHSVVADYAEEGREFAILLPTGTYTKDAGITIGDAGFALAKPASSEPSQTPADPVFAFCQETVTLEAADFVRVRIA